MIPQHLGKLALLWTTGLAVMALGVSPLLADPEECEPLECTPAGAWGEYSWVVQDTRTGGDQGRIAVIVQPELYNPLTATLEQFLGDLAAEGHPAVLATFSGEPERLRQEIARLFGPGQSLTGAVLVGKLPYIEFEIDLGGGSYEAFPTDAFFMDLDGEWRDDQTFPEHPTGRYDYWDKSDAEIWVSRIKVDQLQVLGAWGDPQRQAYIITQYFARNHVHRVPTLPSYPETPDWPFAPSEQTLVYEDRSTSDGGVVDQIRRAFDSVTFVGSDGTSKTDYLERLTASPRNYLVYVHAHGAPFGHEIGGELVTSA